MGATEASPGGAVAVEVQTLGRVRVLRNGRDVADLRSQSLPLSVLVYLAVEREATRDELVGLLWPGRDPSKARHALNQVLHRLRKDLGDGWCATSGATLEASRTLAVDVADFGRSVEEGRRDRALALYGGPFLSGMTPSTVDFEHWAESKRASLAKVFRNLVRDAAAKEEAAGRHDRAAEWARRWHDADPDDDEAAHERIRLAALAGDRASALKVYELYRTRLGAEGLTPLEQTEEMVRRLRSGASPLPTDALARPHPASPGEGGGETPGGPSVQEDVYSTATWPSRPQVGPRLVRVVEGEREGEAYLLGSDRVVIGRAEGDLRFPEDERLSSPHAAVRRRVIELPDGSEETRFVLEDLGGEGGVFVRIRGPWPVREGQVFLVGDQLFRVDPD